MYCATGSTNESLSSVDVPFDAPEGVMVGLDPPTTAASPCVTYKCNIIQMNIVTITIAHICYITQNITLRQRKISYPYYFCVLAWICKRNRLLTACLVWPPLRLRLSADTLSEAAGTLFGSSPIIAALVMIPSLFITSKQHRTIIIHMNPRLSLH